MTDHSVSPHPEEGLRKVLRETMGCGKVIRTSELRDVHVYAGTHAVLSEYEDCDACADLLLQAVGRVIEESTIERCANRADSHAMGLSAETTPGEAVRGLRRLWSSPKDDPETGKGDK